MYVIKKSFFLFLFISVDTGVFILILNILKCDQEHKKKVILYVTLRVMAFLI